MPGSIARTKWRMWLAPTAVYLAAAAVVLSTLWDWPLSPGNDESGFTYFGERQLSLFVTGRFRDSAWANDDCNYGRPSPKVGLYVVGAVARLGDLAGNDTDRLLARRVLMGLLAAGCVTVMFLVGRAAGSWIAGLAAALLLAIHPVFRSVQMALLPEIPMLLFALLALRELVEIERRDPATGRWWAPWLRAGVFAGLAVSCKLYAASVLAPLALPAAWRAIKTPRRAASEGAIALGAAAAVFVISNPSLWLDFGVTLHAMTGGHLAALGAVPGRFFGNEWRRLVQIPFELWRSPAYPLTALKDATDAGSAAVAMGYALALAGAVTAVVRRRWTALLWAPFALGLIGYVTTQLGTGWIVAKVYLLPSAAVALLAALGIGGVEAALRRWFSKNKV